MKNPSVKVGLLLLVLFAFVMEAAAQRPSRRRGGGGGNNTQQQGGTGGGTGDTPAPNAQEQNNNNRPPGGFSVYGNLPISYDSSGVSDTAARKSLRRDNAYDKSGLSERTPLAYEHLRWDDALYAQKVWRELDFREKMNQTFRFDAQEDNGSQLFVDIILRAVNSGQVTAFEDERFTKPMSIAEVQAALGVGPPDTQTVTDVNDPNRVVGLKVVPQTFQSKSVIRMRMKEEWVFDREASRLFVRILGICPLKSQLNKDGSERGSTPMFWLYYPDLRPLLARYEVYNPKNMGAHRMSWEELFESRMFSSQIIKSSLDNPGMKMVRQMISDPILRLVEGENIKEKIFNYEQDLWSY